MLQVVEMTDKEKFKMYDALPKEEIINMLITANKYLENGKISGSVDGYTGADKKSSQNNSADLLADKVKEIIDYIEDKEYNYLNKDVIDFANDVQSKLKNIISK